MTMKLIAFTSVPLLMFMSMEKGTCQQSDAPVLLEAEDLSYDGPMHVLRFKLKNTGEREVTAFEYEIEAIDPHGNTVLRQNGGMDVLPLISIRSITDEGKAGTRPEDSFKPGEMYDVRHSLPGAYALNGSTVAVHGTMVIYDNCTGTGSADRIRYYLNRRILEAQATREALDAVDNVLTRSGNNRQQLRTEFRALVDRPERGIANKELVKSVLRSFSSNFDISGPSGIGVLKTVFRAQADAYAKCAIEEK